MLDKASPLDPVAINDLVLRWQRDRDERARDELVRRFMPTIKGVARRWGRHYRVHPDDADQEAGLGFLRALDSFNPEKGSLTSYTYVWARAKIGQARVAELPMTITSNALNDASMVTRGAIKLRRRLGRTATLEEIAAEVRLSIGRIETALAARSMPGMVLSMSMPLGADGDSTLGDVLPADEAERPDVIAEDANGVAAVRAAIENAMAGFVERHREVVRLRLMEGLTLEEAGDRMGVTKERVRQIESKIVPRLRAALFDNSAVLAMLGREPAPAEEVDDGSGKLLNVAEVEALAGVDREAMIEMMGLGAFPRPVARDGGGHRLWRESTVERWLQKRATPPKSLQSP